MLGRAAIALVLVVAGCATSPPSSLYVRPGLTTEQLAADNDTCMAEARAAERAGPRMASDGTVGGAVAAGVQNGQGDVARFLAAHRACFMRLGYREQALTAEQQADYGALRTDEERANYIVRMSAAVE